MVAALLLICLAAGGFYVGSAAAAPLPAIEVTPTAPAIEAPGEEVSVELPDYGSGAVTALGYDAETRLAEPDAEPVALVSYGSDDAVPIGSVAKVITALMIVDAKPLDGGDGETITFTSDDVQIYNETIAENGSNAPVSAGLEMTQREALTLLLVPSANNYSESLAIWAYGSYDDFLAESRSWLDDRGLTETTMDDSSGLSPETVSTPEDLLQVGELLVADPDLSEIVALDSATIDGVGTVDGTNALLGQEGIDGIKTGTTGEAGSCLLFSFDHEVDGEPVTMVGVFIGAPDHPTLNRDLLEMIPSFNDEFSTVDLIEADQPVARLASVWGQSAEVRAAEGLSVRAWGPVEAEGSLRAADLSTVDRGGAVGTYMMTVNGQQQQVPLISSTTIADPGLGWRLTHPQELHGEN